MIDAERLEAEFGQNGAGAFPVGVVRAAQHRALAGLGYGAQALGIAHLDPAARDLVEMEELAEDKAEIAPDLDGETFRFGSSIPAWRS